MRVIAIGIGASTAFGNGGGCRSLFFDGVNEDLLVTPASNFSFQWTDTWSIESWIFPQSTTVGIKGALSKWDGSPVTSGTIINSEPVTIHSLPDNGNWGVDYLQSMRVWTVELTAAEVLNSFRKSSIPQQGSLLLNMDGTNSTFNGTEFDIVDSTGLNTIVSRNMEIGDLTTNCP